MALGEHLRDVAAHIRGQGLDQRRMLSTNVWVPRHLRQTQHATGSTSSRSVYA